MSALRYPLTVLQNQLGQVPRPSFCTYLVCNRCNAQCGMCDSWRIPRGYEMTPVEVFDVFTKLGGLDVVRLSGGEPFLRADFLELAEQLMSASSPRVLHVTTNGSFPDRVADFARQFSEPKHLRFMVSFDGLARVHDQNRGKAVNFDRALATVQALVGLRHRGIEVTINHTIISDQSLEDHQGLLEIMEKLEVDVQWVLAYAESSMYGLERRGHRAGDLVLGNRYPLHPDLDPDKAQRFVAESLASRQKARDPLTRFGKDYYRKGLLSRLSPEGASPVEKPKCVAVRSHIRLLPDGSVPVCQFNTEVVGNLRVQSLDEVWRGALATKQRAWVDACSGCWAECEVVPNALYSGHFLTSAARALKERLSEDQGSRFAGERKSAAQFSDLGL